MPDFASKFLRRKPRSPQSGKFGFKRQHVSNLGAVVLLLILVLALSADWRMYKYKIAGENYRWPWAVFILQSFYDSLWVTGNSLLSALDQRDPADTSPLPTVKLKVETGSLEKLASALPKSAKGQYYRARMLYPDGRWRRVRYRFRGRTQMHWENEKPSLRVKLRRENPIDLQRHINFVNPEDRPMIANMFGEDLAREFGVLTHRTRMVRLFINNRFFGVYQETTREDESMLRLNRRMPGPFFRGNFLARRWHADHFEIAGETDALGNRQPIKRMVDAIYAPLGPERYARLWSILDRDKTAGWQAAMNLAGGIHSDYHHNHLFFFDPTTGLLEPGIEDMLGHGHLTYPFGWERLRKPWIPGHRVPLNELITPLLDAALRDPRFHHRRNSMLFKALNSFGSVEAQHRRLDKLFAAQDQDVYADRYKASTTAGWIRVPYSNGQYEEAKRHVYDWIVRRDTFLRDELKKSFISLKISDADGHGRRRVLIEVDGHSAAYFDPSKLSERVLADHARDGTFSREIVGKELFYPGLRETENGPRLNAARSPKHYLVTDVQRYLIEVGADDVETLKGAFRHALTGDRITPKIEYVAEIDPQAIRYNEVSVHAWRFPKPPTSDIVLGPEAVELSETLFVPPGQRLIVKPGTTLRLARGVSIASRGPVIMVGTEDRPITVERRDRKFAWGVIAIQGPQATGSRIAHARIRGGSADTLFNVRYSGMVSAHWVGEFRVEDSVLAKNVQGDDTLRVVHSRATLSRVRLEECFGDCVDFDYTDGLIEEVRIHNAGNDGLDFMTSKVTVSNAAIDGAGDKGISGGEASKLTIDKADIRRAKIGVAAKDKSAIVFKSGRLEDNYVAIDVYAKNWRYGGAGRITVLATRIAGNQVDVRTADDGLAEFRGGEPPVRVAGDGKIRILK